MLIVSLSLLGLVLAGLLVLVFYLLFRQSGNRHESTRLEQRLDNLQSQLRINLDGNTQLIQQQVGILTKQIDERLGQSTKQAGDTSKQINERLDNAAKVFGDLQKSLGKLHESNEKIYNVGKDINSLQEILRSPKARGSLGEFFLADLLSEMLPRERYELQYRFKNNEQVDAIIRLGDFVLPIDSKFPLENFKRLVECKEEEKRIALKKVFTSDVKKHIDSISKKYIQPEEGTFDFAFMYIMAENVFYEVITRDDELGQEESLQAYAMKKRIITVSPNSFYAYLMALTHALRGERMQKNIFEIVTHIRHLGVELNKFRDDFERIGHHLNNLRSSYESSEKRLNRYQERMEKIQEDESLADSKKPIKLISN